MKGPNKIILNQIKVRFTSVLLRVLKLNVFQIKIVRPKSLNLNEPNKISFLLLVMKIQNQKQCNIRLIKIRKKVITENLITRHREKLINERTYDIIIFANIEGTSYLSLSLSLSLARRRIITLTEITKQPELFDSVEKSFFNIQRSQLNQ